MRLLSNLILSVYFFILLIPFYCIHWKYHQIWDTGEFHFVSFENVFRAISMLVSVSSIFQIHCFRFFSSFLFWCADKKAGQERFRSVTHAYYRDAHGELIEKKKKSSLCVLIIFVSSTCSRCWNAYSAHIYFPLNYFTHAFYFMHISIAILFIYFSTFENDCHVQTEWFLIDFLGVKLHIGFPYSAYYSFCSFIRRFGYFAQQFYVKAFSSTSNVILQLCFYCMM